MSSQPQIITRAERMARKGCFSCGKSIATPATSVALPSNWQMFKNLVGAAADAVADGLDVRGPEETEAVLAICADCPKLLSDDRGLRCGECGCFLGGAKEIVNADGIKSYSSQFGKTSLKSWHCPLGKW